MSLAAVLVPPMATNPAPDNLPPTVTMRVARELAEMARVVCAHRRGPGGRPLRVVDYIDSLLRPLVTRDHEAELAKVAEQHGKPGRKKD